MSLLLSQMSEAMPSDMLDVSKSTYVHSQLAEIAVTRQRWQTAVATTVDLRSFSPNIRVRSSGGRAAAGMSALRSRFIAADSLPNATAIASFAASRHWVDVCLFVADWMISSRLAMLLKTVSIRDAISLATAARPSGVGIIFRVV